MVGAFRPLPESGHLDQAPASYWGEPRMAFEPELDTGPIMVTVIYTVAPERQADYLVAMDGLSRSRRRSGATRWELYRDAERPDCFVEAFRVAGVQPPEPGSFKNAAGGLAPTLPAIFEVACADGSLVKVNDTVYLHADTAAEVRRRVSELLAGSGATVSEIVKCLGTTRKFGVPICEYLDRVDCQQMLVIPGNHDSRNVGYVHFEELFGERRSELQKVLMAWRRDVRRTKGTDEERTSRDGVQAAKVALGERGTPWWEQTDEERKVRWETEVQGPASNAR